MSQTQPPNLLPTSDQIEDDNLEDFYDAEMEESDWELSEHLPSSKLSFQVTDRDSADWVVGKMLDLDARETRLKAGYEAAKREIERERAFFERRFGDGLRNVALREITANGGRKKSVNLLNGTVGFRVSPEKIEVGDEEKAKAWAKDNALDAISVKVTESLIKKELLAAMKKRGEVPDGCEYVEPTQKFYVSAPK